MSMINQSSLMFSIVTPTYNSERFLAETIESVISQKGDFCIEYIIMDNCSSDTTRDIVQYYQNVISTGQRRIYCQGIDLHFYSEKDSGMYDAINKGFSRASGDLYAWLNSDDIYLPGAFSIIHRCFDLYPQVNWIKGNCSIMDEQSTLFKAGTCNIYFQEWLQEGLYGPFLEYVQQESVFWRADIWHASGFDISQYQLAGDFMLWKNLAESHMMYSVDAQISCFRIVDGQKSQNLQKYWDEVRHEFGGSGLKRLFFSFFSKPLRRMPASWVVNVLRMLFGVRRYGIISPGCRGNQILKLFDAEIPYKRRRSKIIVI